MSKVRYLWCGILLILLTCGLLFCGCGNSIDDLEIKLTSSSIVKNNETGELEMTLTKTQSDSDRTWSATVKAEVLHLGDGMNGKIEWSCDTRYVVVTASEDGSVATITGVTSTSQPTVVTAYSVENRKAAASIYVTNIVVPQSISGCKYGAGELGIPLDTQFSLAPDDVFEFYPADATLPEYEYRINGVKVSSRETFRLQGLDDGYATLTASPKAGADYTAEQLAALSYTIDRVRLYHPLDDQNTTLALSDESEDVQEITLIKNSTSKNLAVLTVTAPSAIAYTVTSRDNIIFDEQTNIRGALSVRFDSRTKQFSLVGLAALQEFSEVSFHFTVSGVQNSLVLTKTLSVRIVDYPTAILVNGVAGNTDVELRVFDQYADGVRGTEMRLNISPDNMLYTNISFGIDTDSVLDMSLVECLLINNQPFTGEYANIKSGTTLYLTNNKGYGEFDILVYAADTRGTEDEVVRRITIRLEQSVTKMELSSSVLDANSGKLILEIDEYQENAATSYRELSVGVSPANAAFDTVTASSSDPSIVEVSIEDYVNNKVLVLAKKIGQANVTLLAQSGVRLVISVNVVARYRAMAVMLDPTMSSVMYCKDLTTTKVVAGLTIDDQQVETLNSAVIARTGSGNGVYLTNAFYPASAVTSGVVASVEFESGDVSIASMINTNSSIYRNVLTTEHAGTVNFTVTVRYYRLEGSNLVLAEDVLKDEFSIQVFEQITSLSVNESSVELLAGVQSFNISSLLGGGSPSSSSVYDEENNSQTLRVTVYPANSSITAREAEWAVEGNTSKIVISSTTGGETVVSAKPLSATDLKVSATIVVSVTDLNGVTFTQEVKIVATKIQQISDVYINNYETSLKNNSLYFELYKDKGFVLDVSVAPTTATNKKVEYIIFDAELLDGYVPGNDVISMVAKDNEYLYYRIKERVANSPDYATQYTCQTAELVYDDTDGTYTIQPKKAGYAFVFIIPQDIANKKVDQITSLTDQLRNVSDNSTIKRLPITVADGETVYYQLYTAEDVASIGSTTLGLTKNYYLMNTIDMSSYFNKQLATDPNWTWQPIGDSTHPFSGSIQSMVYSGESPTQSIVGWTLARDYSAVVEGSEVDYRNYGIWGVVTGRIQNINIYITSYQMRQSVFASSTNATLNNYNYGLLVGRLSSMDVASSGQEPDLQYGTISDVNVYCTRLSYTYTHREVDRNTTVSANIGAIGVLDDGVSVDNLSVTIAAANISSTDMIINFGAIAGKNMGRIGAAEQNNAYTNSATLVGSVAISYDTQKDTLSTLGGAVGLNYGELNNVKVDGQLTSGSSLVLLGGVVGQNECLTTLDEDTASAAIQNVLSSMKIRANANGSIQGGVVGKTTGGSIIWAYYDIYDTQNSTTVDRDSLGLQAKGGYTGGIVGSMENALIRYSIVQAYDIDAAVANILSQGGVFGGIVGKAKGGSIERSFVNAGIRATSGTVAGILGQAIYADTKTQISDVYVRGNIEYTQALGYAFVGQNANLASIANGYCDIGDDAISAMANTSGDVANLYLVRSTSGTSTDAIKVIARTEFLAKSVSDLGLNSAIWAIDTTSAVPTNGGYPYLLYQDGTAFVRLVPSELVLTAKTFDTVVADQKINSRLNVAGDTKKLILRYSQDQTYKLSDLFGLTSDLSIDVRKINVDYSLNTSSVILLESTTDFTKTTIKVIGTGTVYIRVTSRQNLRAYDAIQICVIESFDRVDIVDGDGASVTQKSAGQYNTLKIKHSGSTQVFAEYYLTTTVDKNTVEHKVTGISGGVKFVTGLYDAGNGTLSTAIVDGSVFSNYNISIQAWSEGVYQGLDCLYYYASDEDKLVLTAVGDDRDARYVTIIIPYITVEFYELDADKNITALNSYICDITEVGELSFETQIYYGVSDIAMGVGDGTQIFSSEKLQSSVTIFNDAYDASMTLDDLLWYELYEMGDGSSKRVAYRDPTLTSDKERLSADISVNFESIRFVSESNAVIVSYNVELSSALRKSLTTNRTYRIVMGAIDDDGQKIQKTVSLQWTFIPQEVTHVSISHFSDAINTGAKLTQAGNTPTNTIVAGEYGLLRISLSPDYVHFDSITVTSSVVEGSPMVFDQRVLDVSVISNEDVYTYTSWQQGVGNIENGLSLQRVSKVGGTFDGNLYVRTICLSTLTTGTQFTITVTITANGHAKSYHRTLTVYQTDVLSLAGENYSEMLDCYMVAAGTGYVSEETWEQNRNYLDVQIGPAYYDTEISVDAASASRGAAVVKIDGQYYLQTGGVHKGKKIVVTLTALQDIGGFTFRATRAITFEVVDLYVRTLREDEVTPTTKRFAFVDDKKYDFTLFGGISAENISDLSVITFDPNSTDTCDKVLALIDSLNGRGDQAYLGWQRRTVGADGKISFVSLEPVLEVGEDWIDGNYQFLSTDDGYQVVGSGISTGNILKFEMWFYYDGGEFTLTQSNTLATFGLSTEYINLEFYQLTSQEHPIPIKTLNEFVNMEADIDYILLNDLTISDAWTPLNVAVKSFNGNGYAINFEATSITPSSSDDSNYGLFGTIDSASVIKNVRIVLNANGLAINDDEESLSSMNFGALAGTNNGTIYNCEVYGLNAQTRQAAELKAANPTSASATYNVAGLVAINNGGISNSRVSYTSIKAGGYVSGLVVENSGVVSSSYYSGGVITNLSEAGSFATAGLVVTNSYAAKIVSSYVGGTYTVTDADEQTTLNTAKAVLSARDATIQSGVTSAGFVYANYGNVSDCYSATKIFSTKMSGFAFYNYASGHLSRCYTTSDLSSAGSIIASYPFIGVDSDNAVANNNYNRTDGIVNCYYYDSGFADVRLEEAQPLSEADFCGANGSEAFDEFIFSRDGEAGSEFTGVWVFVGKSNLYFTPDRFESKLALTGATDKKLYTNFGPKLVDASLIATPRMTMTGTKENAAGEVVYYYKKDYESVFKKQNNSAYGTDYSYDPIVVSNMTQFILAFDSSSEDSEIVKKGDVILSDIRIVGDLDQDDMSGVQTLNSPSAVYAGILSGNGYIYENVSLVVGDETHEYYGLIGKLSRVKKADDESINHIGTIKNYSITVSNISCSTVTYVGGMVGWVDSGNLYDVEVTNANGRVVGDNVVGGIAGYVTGTSRVHTAYANVGVTSNYRADTEVIYNHDLIRAYALESTIKADVEQLGYAGGLFGIVDLTLFNDANMSSADPNEARIYNISSDSRASVVGKISGGLIGCVGEYTVVYRAQKTVVPGALVKGYVFSGGIAGQNDGYIKYANVTYTSDVQAVVDSARTGAQAEANISYFDAGTSPLAIGGIVGLNIGSSGIGWAGGTILLCSCKVAVRDSTAGNAGGIAGAVYGGDLRACLATGSVLAKKTAYVGGIVGYLSDFSVDNAVLVGMQNPFGESVTCGTTLDYLVAMNNYLASDYNYYQTLYTNDSKGIYGAIGGIVGYVYDRALLYTTHIIPASGASAGTLSQPSNYYVSQISDRILATTQIAPLSGGTGYFDLQEIGKCGTEKDIQLAAAKTRGYMLANTDEIFAGWDRYSLDDSKTTPDIVEKDVPKEIEVDSIEDLMTMYWHPERNYVLVDDIDFRDYTVTDSVQMVAPFYSIGSESSPFTGTFVGRQKADGSWPVIKNVYITSSDTSSIGFFGAISNATIQNIAIENIYYDTALHQNVTAWVGGLAGVVTNSVVHNVTITTPGYESAVSDASVGIETNANVVGGMFGLVRTIGSGTTKISSCYVQNNLVLSDNVYSKLLQSGTVTTYAGGFAGEIRGNTSITDSMATGALVINYTDTQSAEMQAKYASEIEHVVGGFAAMISGIKVSEAACVSAVKISLENVLSHTRAGGFAGIISGTTLTKVDSHSDVTLSLGGITDSKVLHVGGLVGEQRAGAKISGFVSAGDISLRGTYSVDTTSTTATNHSVAGVVADMATGTMVASGYSLTSIYNDTMFTALDMGFGGKVSGVSATGSVKVDRFYALTEYDQANVGTDSISIKNGGGLDTTGKLFVLKTDASYYSIRPSRTTGQNELFTQDYDAMYSGSQGETKTAPVLVANATSFGNIQQNAGVAGAQYRYYLQTANIALGSTSKLYGTGTSMGSFFGSYNGGGCSITLPAHFDIASGVDTIHCGLFGEVISTAPDPENGVELQHSMILGVVIPEVMVYARLGSAVETFGILAGKASAYTIFADCYIAGELNLSISGATAVGALVGSSGAQYIGCASDLLANLSGDGEYSYGGIYGVANAQNTNYTLIDVYTAGKVHNLGAHATVAGMIADNTASHLFAQNSYTMTEIDSVSTQSANVVYALGQKSHNSAGIWYDSDNCANKTSDTMWETYSYATQRSTSTTTSATPFVGANYVALSTQNYGMPVQKWIYAAELSTASGSGSIQDPFAINTAVQFVWMTSTATAAKSYVLTSDIDFGLLSSVAGYETGAFGGSLDGNYHYISNLDTTLFTTISGTVTRLGLRDIALTGTAPILANSITSSQAVSQIYVASSSGSVTGGGSISESQSLGATFGTNASNCFATTITDSQYAGLDSTIWAYDGTEYRLAGFIPDSVDLVQPTGSLAVSVDIDGTVILTVSSDQDFFNALFYAANYASSSSRFVIQATSGYTTLDLQGSRLDVPAAVTKVTGITTIENGNLAAGAIDKFASTSTFELSNCGMDNTSGAVLGDLSQISGTLEVTDARIIAGSTGGVLADAITTQLQITLSNSSIFVNSADVDLIAVSISSSSGCQITISDVALYNSDVGDLVGTNAKKLTVTVGAISGDSILKNILNQNTGNATLNISTAINGAAITQNTGTAIINLDSGATISGDASSLVTQNQGTLTINVNTALDLSSHNDFAFVETNSTSRGKATINVNHAVSAGDSGDYVYIYQNAAYSTATINVSAASSGNNYLIYTNAGTANLNIGSSIDHALLSQNTGTVVLRLNTGTSIASGINSLVPDNMGALTIYINTAITLPAQANFAFVSQNSTTQGMLIVNANKSVTAPSGQWTFLTTNAAGSTVTLNISDNISCGSSWIITNAGTANINVIAAIDVSDVMIGTNTGTANIQFGVSGSADIVQALISVNSGTATITFRAQPNIAASLNSLVIDNSGTVNINVNSALDIAGLSDFAFVNTSSGVVRLTISATTSLAGDKISGVVRTYDNTDTTAVGITVTLYADYTITATDAHALVGATGAGVTFEPTQNLAYSQNGHNIIVNGTSFSLEPVDEPVVDENV